MCGIIGVFNNNNEKSLVKKGLKLMQNRGRDAHNIAEGKEYCIGHAPHAIVGNVAQPIEDRLVANCEIYNWKKLGRRARNDADAVLKLFDKQGISAIKELDGDYALCYIKNGTAYLARDLIGVKPLFYAHTDGLVFASEKKVLRALGFYDIHELNPRTIITYDIAADRLSTTRRNFYKTGTTKDSFDTIKKSVEEKLLAAIKKRIPDQKFGILFSGGVDSSILALAAKKMGLDFTCYTVAVSEKTMGEATDLVYAKKVAKALGLKLKIKKLTIKQVESYLKKVVPLIEDTNVTKTGVAATFYPAFELAKKDGIKVMLSGFGSEEIFAGYKRHKDSIEINKECLSGLRKMYERDTYRDDVVSMANSIELRVPFLDRDLIEYALKIPAKYKIEKGIEKAILRHVAESLGLPKEFAWRKKIAAQYGSKVDRAITKLTKNAGLRFKSELIRGFYPEARIKLGALVSGGKDSLYAMHVMREHYYDISCIMTIKSRNKESYMFHTPAIDIVNLQAKALGLPMIAQTTKGKKEEELKDLEKALKKAKKKHSIEGVVTGALYSTYQRERIEKICDKLGLKIFSPLWHINQESEMHEILDAGFNFIFTAIAADGLDKTWLGRTITRKDISRLADLNKKIGLNIAGEGGEFESLVIDMPGFKQKIKIKKGKIIMEDRITGQYVISDAGFEKKA